jgi:hypothetical protein
MGAETMRRDREFCVIPYKPAAAPGTMRGTTILRINSENTLLARSRFATSPLIEGRPGGIGIITNQRVSATSTLPAMEPHTGAFRGRARIRGV